MGQLIKVKVRVSLHATCRDVQAKEKPIDGYVVVAGLMKDGLASL